MSSSSSSSSSVNSVYSSSSRLTGLFSNMDTDSIVKDLCSTQQAKIDKEYQSKTTNQWKQDALTEIADAVKDFSNSYCSVLGSSSMLKNSTYTAYKVTTADTSGAVSVTADSSAFASTVNISVQQLAVNSSVEGTRGISNGGELSSSNTKALSDLDFKTPLTAGDNGNISFSINGKTFSFTMDTTLQSMINTVNADSDAGVTMKYSRLTDSFTITADSGGADSKVQIQNISGNAFGANGAFGIAEGSVGSKGQDAKVTIDGVAVTKDSNSFTIDGLSYELNDTTNDTGVKFNVDRDYSSTTDAVQGFVDALNTLITTVNKYTSAKDYSADYPPLTEAQKSDMTDDQIEKWEEKAKSGILRHDSELEGLVTGLKSAFFTSAGGTGENATSIGIKTGSGTSSSSSISSGSYYSYSSGQLELDTDALKKALASNPDTVISIFTGGGSTASSDQQGVIYKVKAAISSYDDLSDDTLDTISSNLDKIDSTMSDMEDKLSDMADKYYEKFSKMETALSKLNSTSGMLSSMFGTSSS